MKYNKKVLKNGLRIITVPMKESRSAVFMVLVETGSDYESKKENGISHFLEHMFFKGTKKRTGEQINLELDSLGASYNAFTGNEYTGYYAKAHFKKTEKTLDIISDMYLNPIFPEKDIQIEKGVILEEINMYEDIPARKVEEVWSKLLYADQPAGCSILGTKQNIKKFKRKDFVDYYNKHYIPQKTVVVVAGNFNQKEIVKKIGEKFSQIKKSEIFKKQKIDDFQKEPQLKIFNKKSDQSHLIIGFRSVNQNDKRRPALVLAATILGGGMSSRLFKKMRDELGICYYIHATLTSGDDVGTFKVFAGVNNARLQEAISTIVSEFKKLKTDVNEVELKKAKDFLLGNMAVHTENSEDWADFYGFQEIHRRKIKNMRQIEKEIKAVKTQDVKQALEFVFKNEKLNLAIVGPHKDTNKIKKLLQV